MPNSSLNEEIKFVYPPCKIKIKKMQKTEQVRNEKLKGVQIELV